MKNGRKREEQKSIHMTLDNGLELVIASNKRHFDQAQRQRIVDFIASIEPTLLEGLNKVFVVQADDGAFAKLEEELGT